MAYGVNCAIEWTNMSPQAWAGKFTQIKRSTLLQHYDYARAVCPIYKQRARWAIIKIDGCEAGLVQIFEAGTLWGFVHAITLDRGPLWFEGFGGFAHIQAFFAEFARLFPSRFGRWRRILPEVEVSPMFAAMMKNIGYKRRPGPDYQTIWLDLRPSQEALRSTLKGKWRGWLRKAEKSALHLETDLTGACAPWLIEGYLADKAVKKYDGPSPEILKALIRVFAENGALWIGRAMIGSQAVAGILILIHGTSATYQIGWTTAAGRAHGAHHLLLWKALLYLKENKVDYIDLGGVNDDGAAKIKTFKEGLGGDLSRYAGFYC